MHKGPARVMLGAPSFLEACLRLWSQKVKAAQEFDVLQNCHPSGPWLESFLLPTKSTSLGTFDGKESKFKSLLGTRLVG